MQRQIEIQFFFIFYLKYSRLITYPQLFGLLRQIEMKTAFGLSAEVFRFFAL